MTSLHGSLVKMEASLNRLGHVSRVAFMGLAAAGAGAVYAFMKEEKELALVSTMLSGKDMQWMPAYEQGLSKLSESTGESMANLAKGLYDVLSATVAPEKAMGVLAAAAKAAIGGATDTATATNAIVAVLNAYKIGAEDVIDVTDKLQMTVNRGVMTYEQFASSIGKAAATSAIAGVSLNELLATVATITRAGLNSDEAMTAVVGVLQTFLKPTEEAKKLAKELGFELNTATLKAEGLSGVFKKLNGLLAEQLSELFPNIRGLKGVAAAMQDAAGFAKDLELITNSSGAAQEAYGKMSETTAHQIAQLRAEFMNLAKDIGKALIPSVRELTKSISDFMATVGPEQTATIIKWGLALAGIGIILPKLATGIKLLSGAMLSLLANPIVFAVGAIVAVLGLLGYAVYKANAIISERNAPITGEQALAMEMARQSAAKGMMDELTTINAKEILTNDERTRALELAKQLVEMYGRIGFAVERTTGKIQGMSQAQKVIERQLIHNIRIAMQEVARQPESKSKLEREKELRDQYYDVVLKGKYKPGYKFPTAKEREAIGITEGTYTRPATTKEDQASLAKGIATDLTAAEGSNQAYVTSKYGAAAGEAFGILLAGQRLARESKAEREALKESWIKGKISEEEYKAAGTALESRVGWARKALQEQAKNLPGMLGEKGIEVNYASGTWKGLADVWKDVQSSVLKKDPNLDELKKQTDYLKNLPDMLTELKKDRYATAS